MVEVAVGRADPALFEAVPDEHKLIGVSENLTDHPLLWVEEGWSVCFDEGEGHDYFALTTEMVSVLGYCAEWWICVWAMTLVVSS